MTMDLLRENVRLVLLDVALDGMAVTLDDWTQFRPTCDGLADNQMPIVVCGSEGDIAQLC